MGKTLAAATVVTAALALWSVGVAAAAPTPASPPAVAPTPASPRAVAHGRCSAAPRVLARIQKAEAKVAARLAKLQKFEQSAQANDRSKLAARIQHRISQLEALEARGHAHSARIEARCPASSGGAGTATAGAGAATVT
jgi:hypothetical protein